MLMLTRRRGESVDVFDKHGNVVITVNVAEFLPNNVVRLGFAAANEYTILRDNAKSREPKAADAQGQDSWEQPTVTYKRPKRT